MSKKYCLLAFVLILFTSCSAEKSNNLTIFDERNKLEKSFLIWKKNKLDNNSIYSFSSEFNSWVGFGNRSKIFVNNETVIKKEYISWNKNREIIEKFIETKDKVGNSTKGSIPHTIDELYEICRNDILKKDKVHNNIYISYDNNNILKNCLYSPKHCADDCSRGIRIQNIKF